MKKLLIVSLVLLGAVSMAAPASGATQYYVKEVAPGGAVTSWGDRQGHPFPDQASAGKIAYLVRSYHGSSTVTVVVYSGGVLRAFNLDR